MGFERGDSPFCGPMGTGEGVDATDRLASVCNIGCCLVGVAVFTVWLLALLLLMMEVDELEENGLDTGEE